MTDLDDNPEMENISSMDESEFESSLVVEPETVSSTADTSVSKPPAGNSQIEKTLKLQPQPPWVGKILGHFKLLRLIGQGKMGRVIQAQDVNLHRIVALKVLNKRVPGIDQQESVNQFLREARAAARIEHPNVVRIYEINHHEGWWYIAMEMLEGENLRKVIKAVGSLSPPRACTLIADAAAGLAVAHQLGIIHRDIKPTNLMLTRGGRCKLTDFGLVRINDPNDPFDFTNKAVGSPHFMAPEVISNKEQTSAIDIYSLGATLYYALTGGPPYTGRKLNEILKKHLEAPVPDIRLFLPDCPISLSVLIKRMMAKDPTDRLSAADLVAALRAEAVMCQTEDSSVLSTTTLASIVKQAGSAQLKTSSIDESVIASGTVSGQYQKTTFKQFGFLASVAALIVMAVIVFSLHGHMKQNRGREAIQLNELAEYFPNAPKHYGVLPPKAIPKPVAPNDIKPPPFSWVGKVDTTGIKFVASKKGIHFYPIDSPEAVFIRIDNFVGYETAEQAKADGRVAAP